jgi:hypothetical protein
VGGDLEGGGSSGGQLQRGRGRGGQVWGKGGLAAKKRERGGATTRVLWEKETTPQMSPDFASNGPQPFPSSTYRRSTFGQHFFGILHKVTWTKELGMQHHKEDIKRPKEDLQLSSTSPRHKTRKAQENKIKEQ